MRRFKLTGPEVLIGGTSFQRLSNTILVQDGKVAVLADDDPRCDDLARSPFLEEVDENGNSLETVAEPVTEPVDNPVDEVPEIEVEKPHKKTKLPVDNGGV